MSFQEAEGRLVEGFAKVDGIELLKEGLSAAASGNRQRARQIFVRVAQDNPADKLSWICLAEISDTLSDRVINLRIALSKDPSNLRTQAMLAKARQQLANLLVEMASRKSDKLPALIAAVHLDPTNDTATKSVIEAATEAVSRDMVTASNLVGIPAMTLEVESPQDIEPPRALVDEVEAIEPAAAPFEQSLDSFLGTEDGVFIASADFDDATCSEGSIGLEESVLLESDTILDDSVLDDSVLDDSVLLEPGPGLEDSIIVEEASSVSRHYSLSPATDGPASTPPSSSAGPHKPKSTHSSTASDTLAEPGHCSFCLELLKEEDGRCLACGGAPEIRDPRLDDTITKVVPKLMLVAVNRLTLAAKRLPPDARAHYQLATAYLNLNRTETAIRWLKRANELAPDPRIEAGLKILAGPPVRREAIARSVATPAAPGNKPVPPRSEPIGVTPLKTSEEGPAGKVVLVVDDSATVRRMITMHLERKGYRVFTAVDGEDGLKKLSEQPVDLVLLDIMLPKLDGYQVCKNIRAGNKVLPIVMLSGKDGFFDRVRGKVAGSTLYMTKPFDPEELLSIVAQYCGSERNTPNP